MPISITKEQRAQALASLERYAREHLPEALGNMEADALLGFMLEELGPLFYNQGVIAAQERMQARVMELDVEVYEEPFTYWQPRKRR